MKRLLFALVASLTIVGCSTVKETQRTVLPVFTDYSKYYAEGFLISPSSYTGEFESIGELDIVAKPAIVKGVVKTEWKTSYETLAYETISYDELVKLAADEAKSRGADAIVNFSITKEKILYPANVYNANTGGVYYVVKGFCIKRK